MRLVHTKRLTYTKSLKRLRAGAVLAGVLAVLAGMAPRAARAFDEPAVRAVRLAYFHGDVTVLRADNTGGDPAQLNMPLLEGARVTTGGNGEAEVEFEDGSLIRITPQSSVVLGRLGSSGDASFDTQVTLLNGLVYAELRAGTKYQYRIDAGGDVVTPVANATVRILLDQPPPAVSVLEGTAQVERVSGQAGAGYRLEVSKGESLRGDAAGGGRYFLTQQVEHNSWDDWNEEREQAAANDSATRTAARDAYAGDQGYGWSDLDANGTWYDTGQGPVWQPVEASVNGFDPYGYGSWVYYSGPGYVWSSGYGWGWTPFRCGSWSFWPDFGWGWMPASGCGYRGGFAFGGGGPGRVSRVERINLSHVPPGYRRPLPPVPGGPVRVHPIVPVRNGPPPSGERRRSFEARQIAGQTAMPLRTIGGGYTPRGGSAVGSSLRRDFPVDRTSRQPVMGMTTAPAGRRGPDAVSRPADAAVGGGTVEAGAAGAARGGAVVDGRQEVGRERGHGLGGSEERSGYAGRNAGQGAGTVVPVTPGGAIVPPFPQGAGTGTGTGTSTGAGTGAVGAVPQGDAVRVHPGGVNRGGASPGEVNRGDFRRGERVEQGGRGYQREEQGRPGTMPADRSVPAPPPPVRPAPTAPAPMVVPAPIRPAPQPTIAPAPIRPAPQPMSAPAPMRSAPPPSPAPMRSAPSPAPAASPQRK